MKLEKIIGFFILGLFFIMCKPKNVMVDCEIYNKKYTEFRELMINDSAFYYIDKAIECSPKEDFYKVEKVKFYIFLTKYEDALNVFNVLNINSKNDYSLLKGVLLLKLKKPQSEQFLRNSYLNYKSNMKSIDSNSILYYIALVNYFEGKEIAFKYVESQRLIYKNDLYTIQMLDVIEKLISEKQKEDVLFNIFNIDSE